MTDPHVNDPFVQYYLNESLTEHARVRSEGILGAVLRARQALSLPMEKLEVADIGCNAGTQSIVWASRGHRVHGLDINKDLIALASERSRAASLAIDFQVGTATKLPWPSRSMDVCLMPELLEHVMDWESCLNEACRVLKPAGALYVSTTNRLCPMQQEFDLPLYSWYPGFIKKHCVRLSLTTKPEWVNHAKYPAIHWFTPYQLRDWLARRGLSSFDRFDLIDVSAKARPAQLIVRLIRAAPPLRWAAHLATPGTTLVAIMQ